MLGRVVGTSEAPGSREAQSAFLRVALVGPTHEGAGRMAPHTVALAHQLSRAGHDVTLVSWSPAQRVAVAGEPFPRTVRSLAWNRPDTWLRTGRRLRGYDAVVIVHTGAAMIPLHLALLQGAGVRRPQPGVVDGAPRGVVLCDSLLTTRPGTAGRNLRFHDDHTIVTICGEIDLYTAPRLHSELGAVLVDGMPTRVVIDMSGVDFCDSTGMNVLLSCLRRVRERGGELEIASPKPAVRKILQVTGLDSVFTLVDDSALNRPKPAVPQ